MSEANDVEIILAGDDAEALLSHPAFKRAEEAIEANHFKRWLKTTDPDERERLHAEVSAWRRLGDKLRSAARARDQAYKKAGQKNI